MQLVRSFFVASIQDQAISGIGTCYGVTRNTPLTKAPDKRRQWLRARVKDFSAKLKGKIVDRVELKPSEHGYGVGIMFQDRTYLNFDVEVEPRITIKPELSDWKTGNYKPLKRWPTISS